MASQEEYLDNLLKSMMGERAREDLKVNSPEEDPVLSVDVPEESLSEEIPAERFTVEELPETESIQNAPLQMEAVPEEEAEPETGEIASGQVPAEKETPEEVLPEEIPVEEIPREEILTEKVNPAEEVSMGEIPAEEIPIEEIPAEEIYPAEEGLTEEINPTEEIPIEEVPMEEILPIEEIPAEREIVEEMPDAGMEQNLESGDYSEEAVFSTEELEKLLRESGLGDFSDTDHVVEENPSERIVPMEEVPAEEAITEESNPPEEEVLSDDDPFSDEELMKLIKDSGVEDFSEDTDKTESEEEVLKEEPENIPEDSNILEKTEGFGDDDLPTDDELLELLQGTGLEDQLQNPSDEIMDESSFSSDTDIKESEDGNEDKMAQSGEEKEENGQGENRQEIDSLLNSITEEEIERLLNYGKDSGDGSDQEFNDVNLDEDLAELLEKSGDIDLSDINDMLSKADNNEAVDESLISDNAEAKGQVENLLQEKNGEASQKLGKEEKKAKKAEEKAKKAEEKKRQKEEKKKAKEAKKASKKNKEPGGGSNAENTPPAQDDSFAEMDALLAAGDQMKETDPAQNVQSDSTKESDNIPQGLDAGLEPKGAEDSGGDSSEQSISLEEAVTEIKDKDTKPKKKGFLAKLVDFFTEEAEDEKKGNENIKLSDENQNIIDELDKEGKKGKGKKGAKPKKEKKKEEPKKAKAEKPKKEPKPKKQKEPKPVDTRPVKKLPKKRVMIILLFGATLSVALILIISFFSDYTIKREAKEAFERGDYQEVFEDFYGRQDLDEREQAMYGKAESVLRIHVWLREYEILADEGDHAKALDSLIQSVNGFKELYDYAAQFNASQEVIETYNSIVSLLWDQFGLTEEQALDIAAEKNDKDYSRRIYLIIDELYPGAGGSSASGQEILPDTLPEENNIQNNNFQ